MDPPEIGKIQIEEKTLEVVGKGRHLKKVEVIYNLCERLGEISGIMRELV